MEKPKVQLTGVDSNVFNLLGRCTSALKKNGQKTEADELTKKVFAAGNYDEAIVLMMEYVDVQ
jgi:hypothetical protein